MDDLVDFLRARLDEDQEEAERGYLKAPEIPGYEGWDKATMAGIPPAVARRVLADIDAKRRTLIRCEEAMLSASPMLVHFAKQTVREMALPYSDRPGYAEARAAFE